MQLLTQELRKQLPPLYSQEHNPDPLIICKFFTPDSNFTWYAYEGSPVDEDGCSDTDKEQVDFLFFGLVVGHETELGYFSLNEMEGIRGPWGLPIERDRFFPPTPLSKVREEERER
jgi:hypothetical protein